MEDIQGLIILSELNDSYYKLKIAWGFIVYYSIFLYYGSFVSNSNYEIRDFNDKWGICGGSGTNPEKT